jgi:hypothetical protein
MQFCWIGLQIETKNTGAVVLRRGFLTKICKLRRRKCAFVIFETHPNYAPRLIRTPAQIWKTWQQKYRAVSALDVIKNERASMPLDLLSFSYRRNPQNDSRFRVIFRQVSAALFLRNSP